MRLRSWGYRGLVLASLAVTTMIPTGGIACDPNPITCPPPDIPDIPKSPVRTGFPVVNLRLKELVPTGLLRAPTPNKYKVCDLARCATIDQMAEGSTESASQQPAQFYCYANGNFDYLSRDHAFYGQTISNCDIEIQRLHNFNCLYSITYGERKCVANKQSEENHYYNSPPGMEDEHHKLYYCDTGFSNPSCRGDWRLELDFYFGVDPNFYQWVTPLPGGCFFVSYALQFIKCGTFSWHYSVTP